MRSRGLVFELFAELPGHGARAAHPPADLADDFGQFFGAEHEQREAHDQQ